MPRGRCGCGFVPLPLGSPLGAFGYSSRERLCAKGCMLLFMGFVLPTLVCGYGWGDWHGGYFIAGVARLVFVQHSRTTTTTRRRCCAWPC
mgnify:CR=1 FL=1